MNPQAVNPDTREKLPICERLLRLFKPETDAGELRTINDTIDTIEALVEALENINRRSSPNPERTFDVAERDLTWITSEARLALSRARNGGQP